MKRLTLVERLNKLLSEKDEWYEYLRKNGANITIGREFEIIQEIAKINLQIKRIME